MPAYKDRRHMNTLKIRLLTLSFLSLALMTGCMHTGQAISSDKLAQIKKGRTTKAQVISLLGPPNGQFPGMMMYNNMQSNYAATTVVGAIVPGAALFTPNTMKSQSVQIWLDGRDVVKDVIVNRTGSQGSLFSQVTGQTPIMTQTSGSQ
jgi:outer membrane protein assembly factor BamE (lipoprotein component of BamABCDE complex)